MAAKCKEKVKKEKDKVKDCGEQLTTLQSKFEELETERNELKLKLEESVKEQFSMIEQFETSKALSFQIDNRDESALNLSDIKKQLELNLSVFDSKIQERDTLLTQLVACLTNAGIEGVEEGDQILEND